MITILRGPAGAGKTTRLYRILLQEAQKHRDRNFILSVPEQFTLSAMRQIMEMSDVRGILNIDVLSFNRLSYRIFDSTGTKRSEIMDDTAKNLLIRQIASEKKDSLKVFGNNLNRQGYVSCVKSVISEFVQYGYGLFDVDGMIEKVRDREPALAGKLSDVRVIYGEFLNRLTKEYMTREELLVRAAKDAVKAGFLKGAAVFLDGFTGFTPVQYEFIQSLYDITGEMYVTVTDDDSGDPLFELGRTTVDHLEHISQGNIKVEEVNDGQIVRYADMPAFEFLGKNIFRRTGKSFDANECISFISAENIEEEVRFVLSKIRELVSDGDCSYRDMAIIMGNISEYADILKKEALRCDVPLYIDMTRGIEFNPFSRVLKSALSCISENMSYESVFNFLKTQMTGVSKKDIDLAENYIRAFRIKGMERYKKEFDSVYEGITNETLEAAQRVRKRLVELLKPLYEIRRSSTARVFTTVLYELILNMSAAGYLNNSAAEFEAGGDPVRKMEFEQIYGKIMELFDRIVSVIGDSRMDIEEYAQILEAGLSEIKVGTLPLSNDCVSAGDFERSRFGDIKVLFFMGLSENNIPSAPAKGGIISDMDRQLLKDNDYELAPTAAEKAATDKFYYYLHIQKPRQKLYLSYSAVSGDGTAQRASYFMKETLRLFPRSMVEKYDSLKDERLFGKSDAMIKLAKVIGCNEKAYALYKALKGERDADRIVDAHYAAPCDRLSEAAAKALFGGAKLESASQLERYAACAYAHYLQYGLKLRERFDFEFDARDIGTLLHDILKNYSEELNDRKLTFVSVTDEESDSVLRDILSGAGNERIEKLYESSARNAYMKKRIERIAGRTVDTLRFQARQGGFVPSAFEKKFTYDGLKGFIDRIDRYEDGQDVYIDIIDYKSGSKKFDSDRIYYGLDLQLVIYMSAAMDIEVSLKGKDESEVHPAGLFYYHIDDPVVEQLPGSSDEEVARLIYRELKLSGIVNSDEAVLTAFDRDILTEQSSDVIPVRLNRDGSVSAASRAATEDDIRRMMEHTACLISTFRKSVREGLIKKEPFDLGGENACKYCSFLSMCDRGKKRKLKKGNGLY
ncbi:MAG: PD-(D/E)XK nuclease family protein [Lachnospiraceae bacterium]|nr:PD-(D/E)XK nuclease family protein [Lachnospiraceae bacterium]